jgi:tetratricopeptide (TPR) repeat protein
LWASVTGTTIHDQAREALRLAEADPGRSVPLATALVREARASGDFASASVAERALGLAALHLKDPDAAMRHLRTAIALGRQAGSVRLAAEAQMRLAFALNVRGRPRQAVREIDAVLTDLDGVERAQAQAQRGAILHQLGRLDEALASYRTALPALRRAHDDVWVKRVLSNRGVLHGQRHEFAAAEADLTEAERLCRKLDQGLTLAFIQQNLGWVSGRRGDVPRALSYLDQAEQRLRALRSQLGWVLRDRSELLLSVGLAAEARQAAEESVAAFEQERRVIALPEVRLLLAQAAAADGDPAGAVTQARRAAREFGRQRRLEWAALARFVVLTSRAAAGEHDPLAEGGAHGRRSPLTVGEVERAADTLDDAGWLDAAVEARLLAGRLALARGWTARGRRQLEQASRQRRRGPATLRARAWHAEALARLAGGDRSGARTAVRAGLRVLDEHRATLGATDLRAHAAGHRVELADLGLRIALEDGRPQRVLASAEQGRASHLLLRPVRPPADPALASDLAELRATAAEIEEMLRAGRNTARLAQRQIAVERRIRDYCRRQPGTAPAASAAPVPLPRLSGALGDRALVEFVHLDEVLYAVTVVDGRARLRVLGPAPPVRRLVERVPFALHRLARRWVTAESRTAAEAMLRHAVRQLDAILLAPLATEVGDRPLVLIPTGPLQSLPWSVLPSCAGRPVTVSPSAALWYGARSTGPARRVSVVAGPDLPGARAEVAAVAAIHGTVALAGAAATVEAAMAALNGAGLAHLAAHGRVHPDHPLFSSLLLADGPLTVYDLERLDRVPRMVILAACDSGRLVVRAGDELLGLAATLLARGAQQIVASVVPIPDAETAPLMVALHRLLVAGRPATVALAAAQQQAAGIEPVAMAAAAGFVCLGADFTLSQLDPVRA